TGARPPGARRRVPRGDLSGRGRAGASGREDRVHRRRRRRQREPPPAALQRRRVGRVGPAARRGDQGAHDQRRRNPRRRRSPRQNRARPNGEPARRERRPARSSHRGDARNHQRARRRPDEQTARAVSALFEATMTKRALTFILAALAALTWRVESPFLRADSSLADIFNAVQYRHIGPPGNRINAVAGVAGDPTIVYAGTASGGVFKSDDGGLHFQPVFDSQTVMSIGALAVSRSDPNVVWA